MKTALFIIVALLLGGPLTRHSKAAMATDIRIDFVSSGTAVSEPDVFHDLPWYLVELQFKVFNLSDNPIYIPLTLDPDPTESSGSGSVGGVMWMPTPGTTASVEIVDVIFERLSGNGSLDGSFNGTPYVGVAKGKPATLILDFTVEGVTSGDFGYRLTGVPFENDPTLLAAPVVYTNTTALQTQHVVVVVPEPAAALLALFGAGFLLRRNRRF